MFTTVFNYFALLFPAFFAMEKEAPPQEECYDLNLRAAQLAKLGFLDGELKKLLGLDIPAAFKINALDQLLLKIDGVITAGDPVVRSARKGAVKKIQLKINDLFWWEAQQKRGHVLQLLLLAPAIGPTCSCNCSCLLLQLTRTTLRLRMRLRLLLVMLLPLLLLVTMIVHRLKRLAVAGAGAGVPTL